MGKQLFPFGFNFKSWKTSANNKHKYVHQIPTLHSLVKDNAMVDRTLKFENVELASKICERVNSMQWKQQFSVSARLQGNEVELNVSSEDMGYPANEVMEIVVNDITRKMIPEIKSGIAEQPQHVDRKPAQKFTELAVAGEVHDMDEPAHGSTINVDDFDADSGFVPVGKQEHYKDVSAFESVKEKEPVEDRIYEELDEELRTYTSSASSIARLTNIITIMMTSDTASALAEVLYDGLRVNKLIEPNMREELLRIIEGINDDYTLGTQGTSL